MEMFIMSLTIFVLAIFVGVEVINKVPPTLHTPLMSGTNAISGIVIIVIIGAIISAGGSGHTTVLSTVLGVVAIALATINIVAGFMVTDRMLNMFKKK
jgi:NAD(P) transhydrogenase subunit alpha